MSTGPTINRHRSEQTVGTPTALLRAVEQLWGERIKWDLACTAENCVAGPGQGWTVEEDSLSQDWRHREGLHWLNPPFGTIGPWAKKAVESGAEIAMLVPASISTNWFRDFVDHRAYVMPIRRVKFVGHAQVFPKDLILVCYEFGIIGWDRQWDWQELAE